MSFPKKNTGEDNGKKGGYGYNYPNIRGQCISERDILKKVIERYAEQAGQHKIALLLSVRRFKALRTGTPQGQITDNKTDE